MIGLYAFVMLVLGRRNLGGNFRIGIGGHDSLSFQPKCEALDQPRAS